MIRSSQGRSASAGTPDGERGRPNKMQHPFIVKSKNSEIRANSSGRGHQPFVKYTSEIGLRLVSFCACSLVVKDEAQCGSQTCGRANRLRCAQSRFNSDSDDALLRYD